MSGNNQGGAKGDNAQQPERKKQSILGRNKLEAYTVCPGSSDPPEKILNIFTSENEVYTIYNYYNILG